ncbi:terminase large subunit domain-containing protein [Lysobacter enzymogenes]|uniref:terminase large subunit domain-containing protein n=1 Tax=Lysobacter enzymogenes TaxID=69 RepID=UPI001F60A554|nr:terminase family protein [Lysobacter enzymogenes]
MPHKFRAFVAGFGSGKTWVGCAGLCQHAWQHPKVNTGYFAPTYPQIRDIFYPTIEEVAEAWGLSTKVNESNKEVHLYSGKRTYRGTIICRSMEKPGSIVGFKIGRALVDEIDILPKLKAQQAWRKIIARLRLKFDGINGVDVTTTPEGFGFVYQQFVKALRDKPELAGMYGLVRASTFENELNLPEDYIPSLMESYPEQLIRAYLRGEFVNLTAGTIYHAYDRRENASAEKVQAGEPVFVGMDFNVGQMAAITHVKRGGQPHAVDEVTAGVDTPDMILKLKRRYWEETSEDVFRKTREIRIYPDASGDSRRSVNASTTDIQLLRAAGFSVIAPPANPPVKDRINSMNAMFCNAKGERRYFVNPDTCPTYADHLEQQVWAENGEPDKKSGNDHTNDAGGYFIHKEYPIVKPVVEVTPLRM